MKQYLKQAVSKHGFETSMLVTCSNCGENTDLGSSYIVAKEDIEHNKDFEKFRTYRQLAEGGTNAYKRASKVSLNDSINSSNKKKSKKSFLNKVGVKITSVDTRSFIEKLRDFFNNRYSYSLYIWDPSSRYFHDFKLSLYRYYIIIIYSLLKDLEHFVKMLSDRDGLISSY